MKLIKKLVFKNLLLNKKRTTVTVVGIILSVALLSALSSLVMSFRSSLIVFEKHKNSDFHVYFSQLNRDNIEALRRNVNIEKIYYSEEIGYAHLPQVNNEYKPYAYIMGTDETGLDSLCFTLIDGRMALNDSEIVIPRHLKTNGRLEYKVGDTITLQAGKRVVEWEDGHLEIYDQNQGFGDEERLDTTDAEVKTYKIVGIIERPGNSIEPYPAPGYTFITYSKAAESKDSNITAYVRFDKKAIRHCFENIANIIVADAKYFAQRYDESMVQVELSAQEREMVYAQIEKSDYRNFYINQHLIQYERIWPMDATFKVIFTIGCFVAVIIILTSVYCIKNSFEISVTEKIRQFGMLAGIGATKKQIAQSVFFEAGLLGLIGIPLGLASGLLAGFVLIRITNVFMSDAIKFDLVFAVSFIAIIATIILGVITVYFSAFSGARKASKVSPIEAIRNQKEIKINRKRLKRPALIAKIFGIGGVISYKNIRRNKKKYRTSVVSIAICTITYILVSYFMSMGFSLLGVEIAEDECNILATLSIGDINKQVLMEDFSGLDTVEKFSLVTGDYVYIDKSAYSAEYQTHITNTNPFSKMVHAIILDDESYARYARECRLGNETGTAIIIDKILVSGVGEINAFDLKKGDTIEYASEYKGENETTRGKISIAGATKNRPFGTQSYLGEAIVLSQSTADKISFSTIGLERVSLCFKSNDADKLQDTLEKMLAADNKPYGSSYDITNRDANTRQVHSLLMLIAIFAYGLITVIALIGVTNIVNTISTSMELRARDFATLRSIGMTSNQFEKMILLEAVFTTIKALFFGTIIGFLGSYAIWKYEVETDLIIPFNPPVKAAVISAIVVFALVYTIIRFSLARINKRNIIETIKNEVI